MYTYLFTFIILELYLLLKSIYFGEFYFLKKEQGVNVLVC